MDNVYGTITVMRNNEKKILVGNAESVRSRITVTVKRVLKY